MTSEKEQQARQIFKKVADLPAHIRDRVLAKAWGGDDALRAEFEALVAAEAKSGESLANPAGRALEGRIADMGPVSEPGLGAGVDAPAVASGSHESVGRQIDRYKLLEQIGEGGFGTVWAAEQKEPVKRRVALKIIKLGMDTKQVIARFEAERQALAMMDHPNIAKVLDAGTTETGRPFFVMELVKGVPILEYCDTAKLDTKARLDLFIQVCNAIQHAHQKSIIHRDIKPSNVLVTLHDGVPVPKVIDFGIAKATNQELTEKTIYTQHRQMIGTPVYMSPEQAEMSGLDIDTRSDIYSLGVLLYELLTGTTPFTQEELTSAGFEGMTRMIREVEPHKPSSRVSSLRDAATRTAELRRVDAQKLGLQLRGDLDWIVMKCLEKDRTRRYETAIGLAADIHRHLDDEPVVAGPPSAGYKLRKFVKRNRGQVIAGSVIASTLVLGIFGTTTGLIRALDEKSRADVAADTAKEARDQSDRERIAAEEAQRAAEEQLARSEEFKGFMVELLSSIEPDREAPERSLAIRELIDTAYDKLQEGLVRDGTARAEIIDLLDATADRHGWYDLQIDLRRARLDEARRLYGREDPHTLWAAVSLAYGFLVTGRGREIQKILVEDIPDAMKIRDSSEAFPLQLAVLNLSAAVERLFGSYDVALESHRRGLELATELGNPFQIYAQQIMISRMLWRLGRLEEALEASDVAESKFRTLQERDWSTAGGEASDPIFASEDGSRGFKAWFSASWFASRAEVMTDLGRHAEALDLFLEAEETRARVTPDDFTHHLYGAGAARALQRLGRTQEALDKTRQAREGMRVTRAPDGPIREASRQMITMLAELGLDAEHDRELASFLAPPSLPFVLYRDGLVLPYSPSGVMGETEKALFNTLSTETPYEGDYCFAWRVESGDSWVAVAWLEPPNDWGDLPGGYDLSGAEEISFVARGSVGGEHVVVGTGVVDAGDYADTLRERVGIELTTEWQRFTFPLEGLDLSTVRCAFVIESELSDEPQTVYFDDIRIE